VATDRPLAQGDTVAYKGESWLVTRVTTGRVTVATIVSPVNPDLKTFVPAAFLTRTGRVQSLQSAR
jgi:hypothetical protein